MELTKYKIGQCVKVFNEPCAISNLSIYDVSGVNRDKEFFEPAKQVGSDTSKYKIVPPDHFACNLMHVGRDMVLPIALNHTLKNKYVSPAYSVFSLKEEIPLLKDYFFILLKSNERDRNFWFHTDSSVRDGMSWEDFCEIELSIPSMDIQQKYIAVYNAMLSNQSTYEQGLDDLKIIIDAIIEKFKHDKPRISLGELINESDDRNVDGSITVVEGVNKDKLFMPSVANGADLSKYKIVKKGQFACNLMHVGRDVAVPIALHVREQSILVSPAYLVFNIKDERVLPEYVLMWLSRKETDRYAWFMSDTNVRSGMEKKRFYEIGIPIPSITEQKALVEMFEVFSLRRNINERLKTQLKDLCPILIKGSLEEARGRDE